MTQGATVAAAITAHLRALEAERYAAATLAARRAHLGLFAEWGEARGLVALDDVTPGVLEAYRGWLAGRRRRDDGRPLSWSTHANMLTAVRMLLAWATRTRWLGVNPAAELPMPRAPKRLPRAVLSVSETERVLQEPDLDTKLGLRDRAILEVLYSTGIRRMELVGLDLPDLDTERQVLFIREGKGKKDRLVPIGARAITWVERYLDQVRRSWSRDATAARSSSVRAGRASGPRGSPSGCTATSSPPASGSPAASTSSATRWRR